jgi:histidinol-phosphatase (PHP family)
LREENSHHASLVRKRSFSRYARNSYDAFMRANYHTHCDFCDGRASAAAMAQAAFEAGYSILGFSSHCPLPFPSEGNMELSRLGEYEAEIRRLGLEWAQRGLEVLLGLEIDWVPGLCSPRDELFAKAGLDFMIGSVHYVELPGSGRFAVDEGAEVFEERMSRYDGAPQGDAKAAGQAVYEAYYERLRELIAEGGFDILGHFDLVRKNNGAGADGKGRYFDEASRAYLDAAFEAVKALKGKDIVAEINVGGISRGKVKTPYPCLPILRELYADGVRITFSADAHAPEHLGAHLDAARELAAAAGYDSIAVFSEGKWTEIGIDES